MSNLAHLADYRPPGEFLSYGEVRATLRAANAEAERAIDSVLSQPDVHQPDCDRDCGGSYICPACSRVCGWCYGCADDAPALCDDCWCRLVAEPDEPARVESTIVYAEPETIPPPVDPEPFSCWASGFRWEVAGRLRVKWCEFRRVSA